MKTKGRCAILGITMKIFAIKSDDRADMLAYLIYYEKDKRFFIELPDNADPWETPILLSSFADSKEKTINSYWSKIWVQQRIIPTDRQNLGQILRDNGLTGYDEYEILVLANGRCAQDDYYIEPLEERDLPAELTERFRKKIEDMIPLGNSEYLVFFCNGQIKRCNISKFIKKNERLNAFFRSVPDRSDSAYLMTGGYGIAWNDDVTISYSDLYDNGKIVPLSSSDFTRFVQFRVINAAEAAELLNCSRQYINELVKKKNLIPIKTSDKNTLFLKSDVLKRKWE